MKHFTLQSYKRLLEYLQHTGFSLQTFSQFIEQPKEKVIVLRHDSVRWNSYK